MIVSHRHRFVFVKTVKTAGTSVEIALSRHCGPDDVITPVSPADERLRRASGGRGPQHYEQTVGDPPRRVRNHMWAKGVRRLVGRQVWDDYFTFTVERNPWDALVSMYHYAAVHDPVPPASFEQFLASVPRRRHNGDIYRIGGRIAVDKVCLYERLDDDLAQVWRRVGLPGPVDLPHAKRGLREGGGYRGYYTPAQAAMVGEWFADTIEAFGYEF